VLEPLQRLTAPHPLEERGEAHLHRDHHVLGPESTPLIQHVVARDDAHAELVLEQLAHIRLGVLKHLRHVRAHRGGHCRHTHPHIVLGLRLHRARSPGGGAGQGVGSNTGGGGEGEP
jgi:hypothetical protein